MGVARCENEDAERRRMEKGGRKLVVAAEEEIERGVRKREKNHWSDRVDWNGDHITNAEFFAICSFFETQTIFLHHVKICKNK